MILDGTRCSGCGVYFEAKGTWIPYCGNCRTVDAIEKQSKKTVVISNSSDRANEEKIAALQSITAILGSAVINSAKKEQEKRAQEQNSQNYYDDIDDNDEDDTDYLKKYYLTIDSFVDPFQKPKLYEQLPVIKFPGEEEQKAEQSVQQTVNVNYEDNLPPAIKSILNEDENMNPEFKKILEVNKIVQARALKIQQEEERKKREQEYMRVASQMALEQAQSKAKFESAQKTTVLRGIGTTLLFVAGTAGFLFVAFQMLKHIASVS